MDASTLTEVERLCGVLYENHDPANFQAAQEQLLELQSDPNFIPQCQHILDNSSNPYALVLASSSLEILVTKFWTNFENDNKLEMRNYILNYLANGTGGTVNLEDYVVGYLAKLACRITKLGWFDSMDLRDIIAEADKFLKNGAQHHYVGLKILGALIEEMNTPNPNRTLTLHRKTAVSFRDCALLDAFTISIHTLTALESNSMGNDTVVNNKILEAALRLATKCLMFDFIGTNPEDSGDDVGTVQVPSAWRSIIQDTKTMQLFFYYYSECSPPASNIALSAIVQLASVRRSIFASEGDRMAFLECLMNGVFIIMNQEQNLEHDENYHEFCRLLGRLKTSYQLSELIKIPNFKGWLQVARDFTCKTFRNWSERTNSMHYLLALWNRMVAALPYLRVDAADQQQHAAVLKQCVNTVVQEYIQTMLDSVDAVVKEEEEDPLEDAGSLKEAMDRLPILARLQYRDVAAFLQNMFDTALGMFEQITNTPPQQLESQWEQVQIVQGKLTWLVQITAAIINLSQSGQESQKSQNELLYDGSLCRSVFKLVELLNHWLKCEGRADVKLEQAILLFFTNFKKQYLNEGVLVSSGRRKSAAVTTVPGGSPVHPMLSYALSGSGNKSSEDMDSKTENTTIFEAIRADLDANAIMRVIVEKLCNNVQYWSSSDVVLGESLDVFVDFVSSYSSGKTLLSLDTVHFMVYNHDGNNFPFLDYANNNKYRTTFYAALSRLVFTSSEDLDNCFDEFIRPNLEIVEELNQVQDLTTQEGASLAIICILRDLRGITASSYNRRTYNLLFDALYPTIFHLLNRVATQLYDDPLVMTAVMKFMQEFVQNKASRIHFDQSSANGILLFRETSSVLCAYGENILDLPVRLDPWKEKYKGCMLVMDTLYHALNGNYVNFGVFNLYDDRALQNALDVSLQLSLKIAVDEVMAYPKLCKAYYQYLEILFRHHLELLSQLESDMFVLLLTRVHDGLSSGDTNAMTLCSNTLDHVMTFMYLNQKRANKPTAQRVLDHLQSDPDLVNSLMNSLFTALLFSSHQTSVWPITRPILSLMLAMPQAFHHYHETLASTQSEENRASLDREVQTLLDSLQTSLETSHRDRFTQKLTLFRLNVRSFLNL